MRGVGDRGESFKKQWRVGDKPAARFQVGAQVQWRVGPLSHFPAMCTCVLPLEWRYSFSAQTGSDFLISAGKGPTCPLNYVSLP